MFQATPLLEKGDCCFIHPHLSRTSGDCKLGLFSLQGHSSFFWCQKWQQKGHVGNTDTSSPQKYTRGVGESYGSPIAGHCWPHGRMWPSFCHWTVSWTLRWWALRQCHTEILNKIPTAAGVLPSVSTGGRVWDNWDLLLLHDRLGTGTKKDCCCLVLSMTNKTDSLRIHSLVEKSLTLLFRVAASTLVGRAWSGGGEVDAVSLFVDTVSASQRWAMLVALSLTHYQIKFCRLSIRLVVSHEQGLC